MKCSWYANLVVLLLAGCVSVRPPGLRQEPGNDGPGANYARSGSNEQVCYRFPGTSHLFKATLDIRKHHLTGLMLIKRMNAPPPAPPQTGMGDSAAAYRIVFMNEVGMTFFDFELKSDSFNVVSCFPSLNKKSLMNILETDFRMLATVENLSHEKSYRDVAKNMVLYGNTGKYKVWQTFDPAGDTLLQTTAKSGIADAVFITFDKYSDGIPQRICIENPFIGMKITLKKLVQQ